MAAHPQLKKPKADYYQCVLDFLWECLSVLINKALVHKTNFCMAFSKTEESLHHNWWTLLEDKILELSAGSSRIPCFRNKIAGIKKITSMWYLFENKTLLHSSTTTTSRASCWYWPGLRFQKIMANIQSVHPSKAAWQVLCTLWRQNCF